MSDVQIKNNSRIEWIDIAKGITIIAMIIGHSVEYGGEIRNLIFSFHMPLFFILSGYTYKIPDKLNVVGRRFRKDIMRLYVPCIVTLFVYHILSAIVKGNGFGIISFVKKILWGNGNSYTFGDTEMLGIGVVWFLIALLLTRLLYAVIQVVSNNRENIGFYIVLAYVGILVGRKSWLPQVLDIVLVAVLFFHIGHLLKQYETWIKKYVILFSVIAGVVWLGMLEQGIYIEMAMRRYPMGMLCVLEAVCGSFLVFQASKFIQYLGIVKNILVFIGRHTLEILCIHCLDGIFFSWREDNYLSRVALNIGVMVVYVAIKQGLSLLIKRRKGVQTK